MNWGAIGAIGELVGAVAVLATLIYLASQIKHARVATTDANRLQRAAGVREMLLESTRNDQLRKVLRQIADGEEWYEQYAREFGISPDDASIAEFHNLYYFWVHWGQYASTKNSKDLDELSNLVNTFYRLPGVHYSWENSPNVEQLEPEFVQWVNKQLEKGKNV